MKVSQKIFAVTLFVMFCCENAIASGNAKLVNTMTENAPSSWQVEFTPYLWTAGLSGDVKIGRAPTETIDASASSLLKALDFGLMGTLEVRKDQFGFLGDFMYIDLSTDLPSKRFDNADLGLVQQLYEFAGTYRPFANYAFDLVGGARYMNLNANLSVSPSPKTVILQSLSIDGDVAWWDGFIGARGQYSLSERWKLVGYADVGTGGSKISWQAIAGVNYEFSKNFIGKIGYRILSEDYDKGKLYYNMRMGGFYAALGIRF